MVFIGGWGYLTLHSSNEPGELSQWLCHDDSTINIVVLIIIIIMIVEINASATLVLQMRRYDNPGSIKYNGDCCDIFCGSCDHSFRFALDRGDRCRFTEIYYTFVVDCRRVIVFSRVYL